MATLSELREFFDMPTREFAGQWKELSDADKDFFKSEYDKAHK